MAGFFNSGFFGGMGGMGGMEPEDDEELDNKLFYELLEVSQTATQDEIKKSYWKLAIWHHPDKGGDTEKFKEISAAYEILSKPDKREIYDKYGLKGLKGQGESGGGFDILS